MGGGAGGSHGRSGAGAAGIGQVAESGGIETVRCMRGRVGPGDCTEDTRPLERLMGLAASATQRTWQPSRFGRRAGTMCCVCGGANAVSDKWITPGNNKKSIRVGAGERKEGARECGRAVCDVGGACR